MLSKSITALAHAACIAQMRGEFVKRVVAQQNGHTGDIVPRDFNLAATMAADYPEAADGSVPRIEMK